MKKVSFYLGVILVSTLCFVGCQEKVSESVSDTQGQEEIAQLKEQLEEKEEELLQLKRQVQELDKFVKDSISANKEQNYMELNELRMRIYELDTIVHNLPDLITKDVYIREALSDKEVLVIDEMEWISEESRMVQLGLDPEDMSPNGFYMYNPVDEEESLPVASLFFCHVLEDGYKSKHVGMGLYEIEEDIREFYPFKLYIMNGEIIGISQYYIP